MINGPGKQAIKKRVLQVTVFLPIAPFGCPLRRIQLAEEGRRQ